MINKIWKDEMMGIIEKAIKKDDVINAGLLKIDKEKHKEYIEKVMNKVCSIMYDLKEIEEKYYLIESYKNKKIIQQLDDLNKVIQGYINVILEKNNIKDKESVIND